MLDNLHHHGHLLKSSYDEQLSCHRHQGHHSPHFVLRSTPEEPSLVVELPKKMRFVNLDHPISRILGL